MIALWYPLGLLGSYLKLTILRLVTMPDLLNPEELSDEQMTTFRRHFDSFDFRKEGSILTTDLGTVLRACGQVPTEAWIRERIKVGNCNCMSQRALMLPIIARLSKTIRAHLLCVIIPDNLGSFAWDWRRLITPYSYRNHGVSLFEWKLRDAPGGRLRIMRTYLRTLESLFGVMKPISVMPST